ncbi:MAG: cytochrome c, partial [Acidobacteriaceae bacterium]
MRFLLGFIVGLVVSALGLFGYLYFGNLPVAVTDNTLPFERAIVHHSLDSRIDREAPKRSPIEPSPTNLLIGAQLYRDNCSACHGYYGHAAPIAKHMFPSAP